jgi:hypothetical protein
MTINILLDKAIEPDGARLHDVLGSAWGFLEEICALTEPCEQDWRYYGRKYGWKLKVHADGKNLCEVTVADGWFLVAAAIREKELRDLESDAALAYLARSGDQFSEGYGIKVEVRDRASCDRAKALLGFIMARRKGRQR